MCGIVGFIAKKNQDKNTIKTTISILKNLEYRGYDSSGIAYKTNKQVDVKKSIGKINKLDTKINFKQDAKLAIAHTRWATHGEISENNTHPHYSNNIFLVHNGIIQNYLTLKNDLIKKGYKFYSQTDTEVVAKLLDENYKKTKDKIKAIAKTIKMIVGSYALAIIFNDEDAIYTIAKDSPLIISSSSEGNVVSSDIKSLPNNIKKYWKLDQDTIGILKENNIYFADLNNKKINIKHCDFKNQQIKNTKDGYDTFMLKEINEQPKLIDQVIKKYIKKQCVVFNFNQDIINYLKKAKYIRIIGCGTAYNAGMLISSIITKELKIKCESIIASEFIYEEMIKIPNTINIVISQSGETADTIAALRMIKKHHEPIIGITNNLLSTIANEVDFNIDMDCGNEIAVASTKAYTIQCIILHLLVIYWKKLIKKIDAKKYIKQLEIANKTCKKILLDNDDIKSLAKTLLNKKVFFIGKNINYALASEAALKYKEITYVNVNAYAAGELKHGNIALIDNNSYVIGIFSNDNEIINAKTLSAMHEVKSRKAKSIYFTTNNKLKMNLSKNDFVLSCNIKNNDFSYLAIIYIFQLLAYHVAKLLKNDIDQPRNLAKSVTVE